MLDKFVIKPHQNFKEKTLLLLKTEAIGDYILFRNFIEQVKKSKRFAGYRLILIGNELWKDMALAYDASFIDECIWINRNLFVKNSNYRKQILRQVNELQVEYAVQANYSREFLIGDALVHASQAKYRIGSKGDRLNEWPIFKNIADEWFTSLWDVNDGVVFEFEKNKVFFEKLIETKIDLNLPAIPVSKAPKAQYLICFPGAGEQIKQWPIEKFASVLKQLNEQFHLPILICGSAKEFEMGEQIKNALPSVSISNECGKTSLPELCEAIANAQLLLSNDSSAFHIAAAVQTPVVCVLMGRHFGRFAPYPASATWVKTIYPKAFIEQINSNQMQANATDFSGIVPIEEISEEEVFQAAKMMIQ